MEAGGVPVLFLPAVAMPKHLFYCPRILLLPGLAFAFLTAAILALFYASGFILYVIIGYGIWHGFWALQYSRDPWIVSNIATRFKLGLIPGFYTNMLIKQKAWVYAV
jgi:hypothetical protein